LARRDRWVLIDDDVAVVECSFVVQH